MNRGLLQSMMLLFTLMGVLGGYTAARLCKAEKGGVIGRGFLVFPS